jgi:hypothetical protein
MAKKRGLAKNISKRKATTVINGRIETEYSAGSTLREGNISLILDDYQDLFSDFDPRTYSQKALSDDFLLECKRAARDKPDDTKLELRLLIPKNKRNLSDENIIKKRLADHFERHYKIKLTEQKNIKKHGIIWTVVGWLLLFISGIIYLQPGIFYQLLFVVFNPAGWFTMWTGFDKFLSDIKEKEPELDFYQKMTNVNIYFFGY